MNILLLDNYDSFTYNLKHQLEGFDVDVDVRRNDEIEVADVAVYDRIVLSPGPGVPSEAGKMMEVISRYKHEKKILGVCLGLQAMAESEGGKLFNLTKVLHGKSIPTRVIDSGEPMFRGIPSVFLTGRYHSWSVSADSLPKSFRITADDEMGGIMALTHENQLLRGVQFHPESILTEFGNQLIKNWLDLC